MTVMTSKTAKKQPRKSIQSNRGDNHEDSHNAPHSMPPEAVFDAVVAKVSSLSNDELDSFCDDLPTMEEAAARIAELAEAAALEYEAQGRDIPTHVRSARLAGASLKLRKKDHTDQQAKPQRSRHRGASYHRRQDITYHLTYQVAESESIEDEVLV